MQRPTDRQISTDENGSNVTFQKFKAPMTSINVMATHPHTIKVVQVSASSKNAMTNTQAHAIPKLFGSSTPKYC